MTRNASSHELHAQAQASTGRSTLTNNRPWRYRDARSPQGSTSLRFLDWIWHVSGSLPLAPQQSSQDAFDRLCPLLRQPGTTFETTGDTLSFRKVDPAAQDKMSVFDRGVLKIEAGASGSVLYYRLTSRALLFCFLAPLMFLAFAQMTIAMGKFEKPSAEESASKKADKAKPAMVLNPIDKALGAPEPEKPKKDGKDKPKDKKNSPTPAYVFATIFAVLYVVGRVLEDRLAKSLFKKALHGSPL